MPAVRENLTIQAGSFEPIYWLVSDPTTGTPLDLTTGFTVSGAVATRPEGDGDTLLTLTDSNFRRTTTGQVYYEPSSATSAAWTFRYGHYQFELRHPSGQDIRFAEGRFIVSPEI